MYRILSSTPGSRLLNANYEINSLIHSFSRAITVPISRNSSDY